MVVRVKTGITGLDSLMQGGLVQGSVYLVTGGTGCGKTIFGCQYLWYGLQKGETCVYVTLEEDPVDIREDVRSFGWDFEKFEKKKLCKIVYIDPVSTNNINTTILNEIEKVKARRLVIDSTALMGMMLEKESVIRRRIFGIINALKTHDGCTSIIITEIPEGTKKLSRFGVEEFVVDGVIVLNYLGIGEEYNRSLIIRKMRKTDHGKDVYPFEIGSRGIVVRKTD
jgi:KaiC/GvpD/RAD55 family RecA-like ATPase